MRQYRTDFSQKGEDELTELFHQTFRMMARSARRNCQVPHAQHRVLKLIEEHGPLSQGALLEMLGVRSSSLSEILAKLVRNGRIVRRRNEADKRGFILSLQEKGENEDCSNQVYAEQGTDVFSCLTSGEREQLRELLTKVIEHNQENRPGRRGRGKGRGGHRFSV